MVARLGGEEFVALLPDVSCEMAYIVAERLRAAIDDVPFTCAVPDGHLHITTSIGGTVVHKGMKADPEAALKEADDALYAAKEAGRNACFFDGKGRLDPVDHKPQPRLFITD